MRFTQDLSYLDSLIQKRDEIFSQLGSPETKKHQIPLLESQLIGIMAEISFLQDQISKRSYPRISQTNPLSWALMLPESHYQTPIPGENKVQTLLRTQPFDQALAKLKKLTLSPTLLEKPTQQGLTLWHYAIEYSRGNPRVLQYLLSQYQDSITPTLMQELISLAVKYRYTQILKVLFVPQTTEKSNKLNQIAFELLQTIQQQEAEDKIAPLADPSSKQSIAENRKQLYYLLMIGATSDEVKT